MPYTCVVSASIMRTMWNGPSLTSLRYSATTTGAAFIHSFLSPRFYALHQTTWRQRRYIGYARSCPWNCSTDILIVSRKQSPWSRRKRRETPPSRLETLTKLINSTGKQTKCQHLIFCSQWGPGHRSPQSEYERQVVLQPRHGGSQAEAHGWKHRWLWQGPWARPQLHQGSLEVRTPMRQWDIFTRCELQTGQELHGDRAVWGGCPRLWEGAQGRPGQPGVQVSHYGLNIIIKIRYIKPLFKDTQICRCYPVAKKIRDYLGTFPKRGGGVPYSQNWQ